MKVFASTSIVMGMGLTVGAAFTVDRRVGIIPALMPKAKRGIGPQPWVSSTDGVKRGMVAMEPERASGNNSDKDFDKLKPNTSIVKPEDLMKEMKEANGFSEWQGSHMPAEEIIDSDNDEEEVDIDAMLQEVDIDAMLQEVEEVLDADDEDEPVIEQAEANIEARADEIPEKKEDVVEAAASAVDSATPAAAAAIAAAQKAEDRFTNKQHLAKQSVLVRVLNRVFSPIFGRVIEKNVPKSTIKGSWISGAFISLVGGLDPITSLFVATGLSYVSVTPGVTGGFVRAAGEATWDSGLIALKVAKNISAALGIETSRPPTVQSNAVITTQEIETDVGEEIKNLVKEVEETVAEVESVLQSTTETRDAWEAEETAERLAEEARHAEIEYLLEEARIEKEAQEFEKEFLAEEARIAEDEKLVEEARIEEEAKLEEEARLFELARIGEESRFVEETRLVEEELFAEEARLAEEERLVEYARLAEEQRLAEKYRIGEARLVEETRIVKEEARIAEEARLAEEAKLAEEVDEIDDDDWQASIQLAEGLSTDVNGSTGNWDAARQLAKDLVDEPEDEPIDFNTPGLSDEKRMELIGHAARAAVEKFEAAKHEEEEFEVQEKSKRNEMKSLLQKEGMNGLNTEPEPQPASSKQDTEVLNYEKMTVVLLKDALRSRGLKMSGRKAELIERLRADDA